MARRCTFSVSVLPVAGRFTFSTIVVPASPRRCSDTYAVVFPSIDSPSIDRIMSPLRRPTSAAGIPSYGLFITTFLRVKLYEIMEPMPAYLPVSICLYSPTLSSG